MPESKQPKKRTFLNRFVHILGVLSLLIGVITIITGFAYVMPQVREVSFRMSHSIEIVERTLGAMEKHAGVLESSTDLALLTTRLVNLMPETLSSFVGTLDASSELLSSTGRTAEAVVNGLPGAVVPEEELRRSRRNARKTAAQLRDNATRLEKIQALVSELSLTTEAIEEGVMEAEEDIPALPRMVGDTREQVRNTRDLLTSPWLPLGAAGVTALVGFLFLSLGGALLLLNAVHMRMSRSLSSE